MRLFSFVKLAVLAIMVSATAHAQQSNNHVLHAVPPPGEVVIDGVLDDWDLSGQIEVFAHYRMRNTYSAKVAAMYDTDYFYMAIDWRDPTPMVNNIDARFDIGSGWRSDCMQLRVRTDVVMHIDCWYSTTAAEPVFRIAYGSYRHDAGPMHNNNFSSGGNMMDKGVKQVFKKGEDGRSYTQEIAVPWRLITGQAAIVKATGEPFKEPKTFSAGDTFDLGIEFLWGGPDGQTWPIHRYADLLKEGKTSREFFWTAENDWGTVKLMPEGNLDLPKQEISGLDGFLQLTKGPVEIRYTMPFDGFATLVIENGEGIRVRNLIGMATRSQGPQVDYWDGLDEDGELVLPGNYRWRGLVHPGINPVYEASYGTPGNPPWDTADGTGAWMSDHKPPRAIATHGQNIVIGAEDAESGWSLIGTNLDGRKLWGDRRFHGIAAIATDDKHAYLHLAPWSQQPRAQTLARVDMKTGRYAPFQTEGGEALEIPIVPADVKAWVRGIAVGKDQLAVSLSGLNVIKFLDKNSARQVSELEVPSPGPVAYDREGRLLLVSESNVMMLQNGEMTPVVRNMPHWANAMTVDSLGRIYLSMRDQHQIYVYSPQGELLNTIGREGGRPRPGPWVAETLRNPAGVAVDSRGRVWVVEEDQTPKRISIWTPEGEFVKDMIGPTGYGGTGASSHPTDKTRLFGSGCEFRLDYENNTFEVVTTLARNLAGEWMIVNGREYLMAKDGSLYLRDGYNVRKVAKMAGYMVHTAGQFKHFPLPELPPGTHGWATRSFIWSDLNDDGERQREEIVYDAELKYPVGITGYFGAYWLDENLNIYSVGRFGQERQGRGTFISRIERVGWTPGGTPIWDIANQKLLGEVGRFGACLMTPVDGGVILSTPLAMMRDDGVVQWTYQDRWHGVHGSHHAPMPDRDDLLVGTLGCIGRARTPYGEIFAMHSNMGRMYLMTADGLFLASVFQDNRMGADPWPNEAKPGTPLGGVTMGSEWFGGHFFRAGDDGTYYLIAGFTSYNLIRLDGLDAVQRLEGESFNFTGGHLAAAERLLQEKAAQAAAQNELTITQVAQAPALDGKLTGFPEDTFVEWRSGPYSAKAAVAVDNANLYLAYNVSGDRNPMVNGGGNVQQLFTTGDSVDLQLGTDPNAPADRGEAAMGDIRLLISVFEGKPVAVLYRWKALADQRDPVTFVSPWRSQIVERVTVLEDVKININRRGDGYIVEAAVPLSSIGFRPQADASYKLDLGVIYSDATGTNRATRVYWSNKATGLTADVPGEIMAHPNLWGTARLAE